MFPVQGKLGLTVTRGKGSYLYTSDGQRILDFYTGHGVTLLGHADRDIARSLRAQISRLLFVSILAHHPARAESSGLLLNLCGPDYARVFFVNSGAEANEVAFKVARKATRRNRIIAFEGAFHGRTHSTLSASGLPAYRGTITPDPSFILLPWDDPASLQSWNDPDIAGVVFEPIQGLAGVREASPAFYAAIAKFCETTGALMIADEVQSGLGRTGQFLACHHFGLRPHLVTLAKGLGNGIPVGAVIARNDIVHTVAPGDHGSTFGGGPLAMTAVHATLSTLRDRDLLTNAKIMGQKLRDLVAHIPGVTEVRGRGLFIGFKTLYPSAHLRDALLKNGVWVGLSEDPSVIRLLPPLTVQNREIKRFASILRRTMREVRKTHPRAGGNRKEENR
ncbi:MAG: aspartate aminotransferase family protein [bacterium JZ-2024 1]